MTPTRRRLIAHHRREPDPSVLNLSYALAVDGRFEPDAFDWALARAADAYPGLAPVAEDFLDCRDLTQVPAYRQGETVREIALRERTTVFDLGAPPFWRAVSIRLGTARHVVVLTWHHMIVDGWALGLVAASLSRSYAALLGTGPSPAGPPVPAWRDRDPVDGRAQDLAKLSARMAGVTAAECDPCPPLPAGPLRRRCAAFGEDAIRSLHQTATGRRMTLFAFLCATVATAVCHRYDRPSAVLGTTVLNRRSTADLQAVEARYDGAVMRLMRDGPAADCVREVAASAERALTFEEQVSCLSHAVGGRAGLEPAVFVLSDRYPLAELRLAGADTAPLALDDPAGSPREVHSPRCGRMAFFFRLAPGGASLNVFTEAGLGGEADELMRDVLEILSASCGHQPVTPEVITWGPGLSIMRIPIVDGLSPLSSPSPGPACGRPGSV